MFRPAGLAGGACTSPYLRRNGSGSGPQRKRSGAGKAALILMPAEHQFVLPTNKIRRPRFRRLAIATARRRPNSASPPCVVAPLQEGVDDPGPPRAIEELTGGDGFELATRGTAGWSTSTVPTPGAASAMLSSICSGRMKTALALHSRSSLRQARRSLAMVAFRKNIFSVSGFGGAQLFNWAERSEVVSAGGGDNGRRRL